MYAKMNTQSASATQKLTDFINTLANLIKNLGTIFGCVSAMYLAAVNYFPASAVGALFARAGDPLIATQRFSEGYLYYEVGKSGGLTPYGQLVVLPGERSPAC